jgi:hypothetical protein
MLGSLNFLTFSLLAVVSPAGHPRVVVVEQVDLPSEAAAVHADIQRTAETAARQEEWSVLAAAPTEKCNREDCLDAIGRRTSATHVLLVEGAAREKNYVFYVRQLRVGSGWAGAKSDPVDCAYAQCELPKMVEEVGSWTREVLAAERRHMETGAPTDVAAPLVTTAPAADTTASPGFKHQRLVGGLLAAAGVLAGLTGGVLWYLDGRPTDCQDFPGTSEVCRQKYSSSALGIPLALAGAAGAGVGGWLFFTAPRKRERPISVTLLPTGLSVSGRF